MTVEWLFLGNLFLCPSMPPQAVAYQRSTLSVLLGERVVLGYLQEHGRGLTGPSEAIGASQSSDWSSPVSKKMSASLILL